MSTNGVVAGTGVAGAVPGQVHSVHMVIDFMHIYYKYKFMAQSGRLRRLSNTMADGSVKDTTLMYYCLRDIENMIKRTTTDLNLSKYPDVFNIAVTVCVDSKPTERKEKDGGEQYKANRSNKLTQEDLEAIGEILLMLGGAGYTVLSYPGVEADDLAYWAVGSTVSPDGEGSYYGTVVVTNDSDLLSLVRPRVIVRVRRGKEYEDVTVTEFSQAAERLLGAKIPYNCTMLYKCTVGDKSDNIPGIRGFGGSRWDSLVYTLENEIAGKYGYDIGKFNMAGAIENLLKLHGAELGLTPGQVGEALTSLGLVAPSTSPELTQYMLSQKSGIGGYATKESRQMAYERTYGFSSLVW